jgi:bacillolysin
MPKLYNIILTEANPPTTGYTIYYNSVNAATIATIGISGGSATNLTKAQLVSPGLKVSIPDAATSILVYSQECGTTTSVATPTTLSISATAANITGTTLTLNWTSTPVLPVGSNFVVFQGGILIATLVGELTYNVTGLTASTPYNFTIQSKNSSGNVTGTSNNVAVSTIAGDTTPPTTPVLGSIADFGGGFLRVSWSASTDASGIAYYEVYRAVDNGILAVVAQVSSGTIYDDYDVFNGSLYSYSIRAVDTSFNQSNFSNTQNYFY